MKIYQAIHSLLQYGVQQRLLEKEDVTYSRNRILYVLGLDDWEECEGEGEEFSLGVILNEILDWAFENGILSSNSITERDILDTELMNCLMPRPSAVISEFKENYLKSPKAATDHYYHLSLASNYIRKERIAKIYNGKAGRHTVKWTSPSIYQNLKKSGGNIAVEKYASRFLPLLCFVQGK